MLRRLGHDTIHTLTKPDFKTPATKVEGIWKDPKGYAEREPVYKDRKETKAILEIRPEDG